MVGQTFGTKIENGEYLATGGRVLNIVVTTENFKKSKEQAIKILNELEDSKKLLMNLEYLNLLDKQLII